MDKEVDKLGTEYRCVYCGRFVTDCTCDFKDYSGTIK